MCGPDAPSAHFRGSLHVDPVGRSGLQVQQGSSGAKAQEATGPAFHPGLQRRRPLGVEPGLVQQPGSVGEGILEGIEQDLLPGHARGMEQHGGGIAGDRWQGQAEQQDGKGSHGIRTA